MSATIYTPLLVPLLDAESNPVRLNKFTYSGQAMGERKITATLTSPTTLALVSGCYITFRSETFKLYETPPVKKKARSATSQDAFEYTLTFYSAQHELATTDFIDIVSDDSHTYFNGGPVIDFVGTIGMLAERIKANLDRIYSGANQWEVLVDHSVDELDPAQISLTDSTVWDALMLVNTTQGWGANFMVRGRVITIGVGGYYQSNFTFEYGKGKGLYEINRTNTDSTKLITRLRAYGGSQNIPSDYKKDGSGYVAPSYQYIKELMIPEYGYVKGATVNAVGKGTWSAIVQYSVGDLVRYDRFRFYARAIPTLGYAPPLFSEEWNALIVYMQGDVVKYEGLIYTCQNDSTSGTSPDVDTVNWTVDAWAVWSEGYLQVAEATNENWVGEWNAITQYQTGDVVSFYGALYEIMEYPPAVGDYPPTWVTFSLSTQYTYGDRVAYNNRIWEFVSEELSVMGQYPTEATWDLDEEYGFPNRAYEELGIREGIFRDDSIYPTLKGITYGGNPADDILAVLPLDTAGQTYFKVWIRDIGFDINDYLGTETPTFTVARGVLAGYDFEISKVEESVVAFTVGTSAYVLTLVRNSEDAFVLPDLNNSIYQAVETVGGTDYLVPNSTAPADYAKFVLTGILMPNIYVRAAEEKLLTKAQAHLAKYSRQQVTYSVGIDEIQAAREVGIWADSNGAMEGDYLGVIDTDLGVHGTLTTDPLYIPIQSLTITVGDGMIRKYDVVLSDEPIAGTLDGIRDDIKENGKSVEITGRKSKEDIRKEALTNLYLKAAMAGDTEIDGGLLLTNLLLMRDDSAGGAVNAGLSGFTSDLVGLWVGGSYDDAQGSDADPTLVAGIDRKDGSGHRAFGKMLWDVLGNLIISGGTIGNLAISGSSLSSKNMEFVEEPIETLATLKTASSYAISRQASWNNVSASSRLTASVYTQDIVLSNRAMLRFIIGAEASFNNTTEISVINTTTSDVVWSTEQTNIDGQSYEAFVQLDAGTYHIAATITAESSGVLNLYTFGYETQDTIAAKTFIMKTKIGNNGFYSFWDDANYFYYNSSYGVEFRAASYGLAVLQTGGFMKYSSGSWTTWTP